MFSAIWRLAPTHHSKVYWPTKSALVARLIENAWRLGGFGVDAGTVDGTAAGADVAVDRASGDALGAPRASSEGVLAAGVAPIPGAP